MASPQPISILLSLALASAACQSVRPDRAPGDIEAHVAATKSRFIGLCEVNGKAATLVEKEEAGRLARTAEFTARRLAADYGVHTPALVHNCLINLGLKNRGLCWQYMEDLYAALRRENPRRFILHSAVQADGNFFLEHNAVVITAHGQAFDSGLVLDPWRHPGTLFLVPVTGDKSPWVSQPGYRQDLENRHQAMNDQKMPGGIRK